MNVVGKVGTLISRGVYSVATPFHPFGGAVDIIVVEQQDGSFRSTPWYVRFGKFQGVLKGAEQMVRISVNGVEANFHMCLDNSGEAYFTREIESISNEASNQDLKYSDTLLTEEESDILIENNAESDAFEYQDVDTSTMYRALNTSQNSSLEFPDNESQLSPSGSPHYGTYYYESLDHVGDLVKSQASGSEVVLVSGDGLVLLAPISSDDNTDNLQLHTPLFELCPGKGEEDIIEHLETSSKSGINGLHVKIDENVCSNGVHNDDYCPASNVTHFDDSDSVSSISLSNNRNVKIFSEGEDGDDLSIHFSVDDLKPNMKRSDVFKSCLEFSELTSEFEAENMQKDGTSPVGLESDGRTFDELDEFQSSFMTRDSVREGDPLKTEKSLSVSNSCNSNSAAEDADNRNFDENALVDRRTEFDVLQNVLIVKHHNELKDIDESLSPSGGCQEPACFEAEETNDSQTGVSRKSGLGFEISLCGNIFHAGMGAEFANEAFNAHIITEEKFKASRVEIVKNKDLIVRYRGRYFTWNKSASIVLGMAAFGLDLGSEAEDAIPVEKADQQKIVEVSKSGLSSTPSSSWIFWPNPFRRTKPLQHTSSGISNPDDFVDAESYSSCPDVGSTEASIKSPKKQIVRTNLPSSEQIASLNLMDGQNKIAFIFSTRVLGEQKVDAHIYLWKWNARIVISDVDGTITKSDVLGQFMPLFGRDWSQLGVARLFSAIEENGYQLLFLSARAIVQAYLTRSFLRNLKQDGEALPSGPVVISPDGLFPSLYREVILRRPHEFKIACLEDIRALFPSDYNPFYAGFGNRETDEISYRKVGIPKGKIFIINPKGEVAVHRWIDAKSYTSLHTLVDDMFPPTSLLESEDYNSWNYWKVPLPNID